MNATEKDFQRIKSGQRILKHYPLAVFNPLGFIIQFKE